MFSADSKALMPRPILCARLVKGFHWLFVPHRIQFNIITLMHNSMVEQLLHTIRTLSFSLSGRSTLGSADCSLHACAVLLLNSEALQMSVALAGTIFR